MTKQTQNHDEAASRSAIRTKRSFQRLFSLIIIIIIVGVLVGISFAISLQLVEQRKAAEAVEAAEQAEEALLIEQVTKLVDIDADEVTVVFTPGTSFGPGYGVKTEAQFCATTDNPQVLDPAAFTILRVVVYTGEPCFEVLTVEAMGIAEASKAEEAQRDAVRYVLGTETDHITRVDGALTVGMPTYEANALLRDPAFRLRLQDARLDVYIADEMSGTTLLSFTPTVEGGAS